MSQVVYSNVKVIGVEKVEYLNYRGQAVNGIHLDYVSQLSDENNLSEGVRCHRQWITLDVLGPYVPSLGEYYNIYYDVCNGPNGSYEKFCRIEKNPFPTEFKVD